MEPSNKIRFGGIKLLTGGSCLVASSPGGKFRLGSQVTGPLAENRLNLTFLTHMAGDRTALCTAGDMGEGTRACLQGLAGSEDAFQYQPDIALLAVYPHDKLPQSIGGFIHSLAASKTKIFGLASSLSSITVIVEKRRQERVVNQLFDDFRFTSFASAREFSPPRRFPKNMCARPWPPIRKRSSRFTGCCPILTWMYGRCPSPPPRSWGISPLL